MITDTRILSGATPDNTWIAFRPDIDTDLYIRKTFGVRVIIAHDHDPQRKNGYRLITAFPINERKKN